MQPYLRDMAMRTLLLLLLTLAALGIRAQETDAPIRVVLFLSPSCPICQYYALPLREMAQDYSPRGVEFEALVPGRQFSAEQDAAFRRTYELPFAVLPDLGGQHYTLGASVTPEVFVFDRTGKQVYTGRIDDSYAAIGKRRSRARTHELRDALDALLLGETVKVSHAPPIGCLIQK